MLGQLRTLPRGFWLLLALALLVRLGFALIAPHPGISDPNHYFNLASNLADGRGFVIDYIWQYHNPPATVTHPIDYWMPLPAVYPALSMALFGKSLFIALIPSVLIGSLIPILAYGIATVARCEIPVRLMAMGSVIFLPEFVLNSVRTDTTISYILHAGIAMLAFYVGMRRSPRWLVVAGIFAGLTQLSRQDGVILAPAMILALLIYWRWSDKPLPKRWLIAIPVGWLLVMTPWFIHNWQLFGVLLPSGAGRTLFMTSFIDQFTYGRDLNLQHYLDWGWGNILSNMAIQALANVKMSYTLLDIGLPVTALLGIGMMIHKRDRERLLLLVLPLSMTLGLFVFYSFLTPFHTQGGSFKKSYMLLIPFLAFAGAYGLHHVLAQRRIAYAITALIAGFMFLNMVDLFRNEFILLNAYENSVTELSHRLDELGDTNGDDKITIMTQDPFMLSYHGYPALMIPSDPLDLILEAAERYQVDYILLPAGRDALDPIYDGTATDPRLTLIEVDGRFELLSFADSD